MSKGIRYLLALMAILAWAAFMAASMTANVKFGLMIAGQEDWNPWVIGGATAASDVFKAITPIAGLYFLFRRWWWPAAAALVVLVVTVSYSTIAAIGFASVTRAHYSDERTGVAIRSTGTKADLEDLRSKRAFLPRSRPVGVVENDISKIKLEKAWTATDGCKTVEAWSRKFCGKLLELQSELASAKEAQKVAGDIATLEARFEKGGGYVSDPDPQAKQLAKLTGMDREDVKTGLVLLLAALLEFGSAFGLTMALALIRPEHGLVAEALSVVTPAAKPEDPRKVPAPVAAPTPPPPGGPGTPAPLPETSAPPTHHARGVSKILVGIKPINDPAPDPTPAPQVVRRLSLKPPFIVTEPARKIG